MQSIRSLIVYFSGDSGSVGLAHESSVTIYIVERELVCFVYLCQQRS